MNKTISVVVPVYNVEQYLDQCIESIVEQTYSNLEIIIVNDGSTDCSGEKCDAWSEKDIRIKVVHQNNKGLSGARNTGIDLATGRYITFIDSDDYIEKNMIQYLYQLIVENAAQISVCQTSVVSESGEKIENDIQTVTHTIHGNRECMEQFFVSNSIDTVAWGKLYLTELFQNVRYTEKKYHEDVFTTYKLIAKCECIAVGDLCGYNYRWRAGGISKIAFAKKHLDSIEGATIRKEFIEKNYPDLTYLAEASIVYAANQCVLKYAKSNTNDKDIVEFLQKQYRKYEMSFLKGVNSRKAKIFSLSAYINLKVLIKIYRIFK